MPVVLGLFLPGAAPSILPHAQPPQRAAEAGEAAADDGHEDDVLQRIAALQASKQFDDAAAPALTSLRATAARDARAPLELALGRARYANDDHAEAKHLLDAAFFSASASGDGDTATEAALLRFDVTLDTADLPGAAFWDAEVHAWLERRTTPAASLRLCLAVAESKQRMLQGRPQEALSVLPSAVEGSDLPVARVHYRFKGAWRTVGGRRVRSDRLR